LKAPVKNRRFFFGAPQAKNPVSCPQDDALFHTRSKPRVAYFFGAYFDHPVPD